MRVVRTIWYSYMRIGDAGRLPCLTMLSCVCGLGVLGVRLNRLLYMPFTAAPVFPARRTRLTICPLYLPIGNVKQEWRRAFRTLLNAVRVPSAHSWRTHLTIFAMYLPIGNINQNITLATDASDGLPAPSNLGLTNWRCSCTAVDPL